MEKEHSMEREHSIEKEHSTDKYVSPLSEPAGRCSTFSHRT